jgi:deoxyadenosine/deoxycytidine kinase
MMLARCISSFRLRQSVSFMRVPKSILPNKLSSTTSQPTPTQATSFQNQFNPILISIEGNIGAGKTTLLQKLRQLHPEWLSIDEPVETWSTIRNEDGESILEVFYKDRKRWSYTFQNCALLTRYENIEATIAKVRRQSDNQGTHIFFTERCLETDYHVFTKMLRSEGSINSIEIELYERLLSQLKRKSTALSGIIYVNATPSMCLERIKKRGRVGEEGINMDYLEAINKYQDHWMHSTNTPICISDTNHVEKIESFITSLVKGSANERTNSLVDKAEETSKVANNSQRISQQSRSELDSSLAVSPYS